MIDRNAINDAAKECHEANSAWWYDENGEELDVQDGVRIALMHSELSEALEGLRTDSMDAHLHYRKSVEVELADTLIRIFDYAGARGFDLGAAMIEKMAYNKKRADHKRESRQKVGGKKF